MAEMKIVTEKNVGGVDQLVVITTPAFGNQGQFAGIMVDEGKPAWVWPSIPGGTVIGCNFAGAPTFSKERTPEAYAANQALIDAITVAPGDALTYL